MKNCKILSDFSAENIYNFLSPWYTVTMNEQTPQKKFYMHKIDNLLNVRKIVTIHYQALTKNYAAKEEWHDFWEIIYADKGDVSVWSDEKELCLRQGEICFISPNLPHYVQCGNSEPNIFIISFECRSESMRFFHGKKIAVPKTYMPLLQNIMSEALATFELPDFDPDLNRLQLKDHPNLGGEQMIKNSLELLLIYLLRKENDKNASQTFFISKISTSGELQDEIVRILRQNVYGRLRMRDLCDRLHYSQAKISVFFKEKTGASIYETYLRLKIDEAKKLIRKGVSFTETAEMLCFDSVSAFNKSFRKRTGMTPKQYRFSIDARPDFHRTKNKTS